MSGYVNFVRKNHSQEEVLKTTIVKKVEEQTTSFQPDVSIPDTGAALKVSASPDVTYQNYDLMYACTMPDPSQCYATGRDLEIGAVEEESSVLLHAIDFNGEPCERPIESLYCELVSEITGVTVRGSVERREQNQYEIIYQPTVKGRHQLHIKVEGQHIRGSPFVVTVKLAIKKLGTRIQAISGVMDPWGVAVNQREELVVTDCRGHCVSVFSPGGKKLRSFGTHGRGNGQLSGPFGVAVDGEGNILVVDNGNHRVQKFTKDGQFLTAVGSRGNEPLQFNRPLSIAFNPINKKVYVGDCNHHIQVLNSDFTFSHAFSVKSHYKGQFYGMACDSTGKVYAADCGNNCILVFTAEGKLLKKFSGHGLSELKLNGPISIAIDTGDVIYVSECFNHRVSVFNSKGHFVTLFSGFKYPSGLAVDSNGTVYVCDRRNNCIHVF